MPDTLAHLPWPYQLGETVDQDTDAERLASAAVIVCTPRGHRDDLPDFGVTTPVFQQGNIDLDRLAGEIEQSDPRLAVDADEFLDLTDATVRTVQVVIEQT
jgi:hypothetical protein